MDIWKPIDKILTPVLVSALRDDSEGFRVLVEEGVPGGKLYKFLFDSVVSYRSIPESFSTNRTLQITTEEWPFFVSRQTDYIDWFIKNNNGVMDVDGVIHYAIWAYDYCVDVLAFSEPTVECLIDNLDDLGF